MVKLGLTVRKLYDEALRDAYRYRRSGDRLDGVGAVNDEG